MDIASELKCCLAYIEGLNTVRERMAAMQEQYLSNEKNKKEVEYLKSLHANDSEVFSMDNWQESMGHNIIFKVQLNVYQPLLAT